MTQMALFCSFVLVRFCLKFMFVGVCGGRVLAIELLVKIHEEKKIKSSIRRCLGLSWRYVFRIWIIYVFVGNLTCAQDLVVEI